MQQCFEPKRAATHSNAPRSREQRRPMCARARGRYIGKLVWQAGLWLFEKMLMWQGRQSILDGVALDQRSSAH